MNILNLLLVDPNLDARVDLFRDDATGTIFMQAADQHWYGSSLDEVLDKAMAWYKETQL